FENALDLGERPNALGTSDGAARRPGAFQILVNQLLDRKGLAFGLLLLERCRTGILSMVQHLQGLGVPEAGRRQGDGGEGAELHPARLTLEPVHPDPGLTALGGYADPEAGAALPNLVSLVLRLERGDTLVGEAAAHSIPATRYPEPALGSASPAT